MFRLIGKRILGSSLGESQGEIAWYCRSKQAVME